MRFDVGFGGFLRVELGVDVVTTREMCVVRGLFMIPGFMMRGRFFVMMLSETVVLRSLVVVFRSLL